jgi:hypothetical protein
MTLNSDEGSFRQNPDIVPKISTTSEVYGDTDVSARFSLPNYEESLEYDDDYTNKNILKMFFKHINQAAIE